MRRIRRLTLLTGVIAISLAGVSSAHAAVAVVFAGGGANTGTATTAAKLVITDARRATTTVNCTGSTFRATYANAAGANWPQQVANNGALDFTGCTLAGGALTTIGCTVTATVSVTGITVAGVTPLTIGAISCALSLNTAPVCNVRLTGSVNAAFSNNTSLLALDPTGLAAGQSTCTATFLNGVVTLTSPAGANLAYRMPMGFTITAT